LQEVVLVKAVVMQVLWWEGLLLVVLGVFVGALGGKAYAARAHVGGDYGVGELGGCVD
jgi:hypothetical protein